MRRYMLIISIVLLASLILVAIFRPQLLEQAWIWLVGFAGFIYSGIRGLAGFFQPDQKLQDIEASNEEIRRNYLRIQQELETARQQLQQERAAQQREIDRLENRLNQQKVSYQELQNRLHHLQKVGYQEYLESLSPEEKRKIEDDIWGEVDFGL